MAPAPLGPLTAMCMAGVWGAGTTALLPTRPAALAACQWDVHLLWPMLDSSTCTI